MGVPGIRATVWGSLYCNKGYSILGSKLGYPYLGKLPYVEIRQGHHRGHREIATDLHAPPKNTKCSHLLADFSS